MATKVEVAKSEKGAKGAPTKREVAAHPFLALREQMDRLFEEFASDWRMPSLSRDVLEWEPFRMPAWGKGMVDVRFDLSETDDALEVTAELPGMDEKDVEVVLSDGVLTLKGEKRAEKEAKEKEYYVSERRFGAFTRSLRLPDTVEPNKIKATFEKGVLKVVAPKHAAAKAKKKKIPIGKK